MRRWLVLVVLLAACSGDDGVASTGPTFSEDPTFPPSTTAPEPLTLSAGGEQNTDPFELEDGDYTVTFDFTGPCSYFADLVPLDQGEPGSIGAIPDSIGNGTGPTSGTSNVYKVQAGTHYVRVITGPTPDCPWTVTLTRR